MCGLQGMRRWYGATKSLQGAKGKQGCSGTGGVTSEVVVFSQREHRIINAQLGVKVKLPAKRQGMQAGAC